MNRDDEARVGTGRLSIHVGITDCAVLIAQFHNVVNLVFFANVSLCHISDVDTFLLVFMHFKIGLDRVKQISDLFHVDFDHADFDRELELVGRVADLLEDHQVPGARRQFLAHGRAAPADATGGLGSSRGYGRRPARRPA